MHEKSPANCFRLLGEMDGARLSFVLAVGEYSVGTDPACDVVLPIRGVSRRHARLIVSAAGVRVADLGSKNGSYINEQDSDGQLALIGDELRFGPVGLSLLGADPEEARLGLSLDPASGLVSQAPSLETTWLPAKDPSPVGSFGLLEVMLDRLLKAHRPDLEGGLLVLLDHGGADGAALVRWPAGKEAFAIASSGSLGSVPRLSELPAAPSGKWRLERLPAGDGWLAWQQHSTEAYGLLYWGHIESIGRHGLIQLARLLTFFASARVESGPAETDASIEPKNRPHLRLPTEIVRGQSPAMEALYRQMAQLLESDVAVLILGETGVGKEHLAKALHDSGPRRAGPFVAVNCAAIPKDLLEAEMFGIGRGVATGVEARRGKFSEARGGTLLLDEIGEMPAALQAKLLRVLQEKEIHPIGRAPEAADVRVLAATNIDLDRAMQADRFRRDLYYRLAGYVLEVPALRRRREDIPLLIGHFLRRFSLETSKPVRGVTVKALRRLIAHGWPGNIRELEHEIRRLVFLCPPHQVVDAEMVAQHLSAETDPEPAEETADDALPSSERPAPPSPESHELPIEGLESHLREIERDCVMEALRRTAGNQSAAARLLKISRNGLAKRIKRLDIDVSRFLP